VQAKRGRQPPRQYADGPPACAHVPDFGTFAS
jgi:hypothetical protein